ncbi:MAG TPA: TetR/AcrR family transcriptional regulator [Novosphingobium sp.]|nr:TetR/AcrR family transcriptional regulator [Novosphingobium sp.]HMP56556.1 TetR/AcrR family transcriptional regulator [Novosphingobium sp.]
MALAARRIGAENSVTRAMIIDATEALIRAEGYAAVSTRRVAAEAGLKPSLVHYYFPTTDDLFLAVCKRGAEESDAMIAAALAAPDPLRALWHFFADPGRTAISLEFMALANHRKAIRAHILEHSEAMRARQVAALEKVLEGRLDRVAGLSAEGLMLVLAGIGRALIMEGGLGVEAGHGNARAFVDNLLDRIVPPAG